MRAFSKIMLLTCGLTSAIAHAAYPECPAGAPPSGAEVAAWRADAVKALAGDAAAVAKAIESCFGKKVPACLQRTQNVAVRNDTASSESDASFELTPQRQPPPELLAPGAQGLEYVLPEKIEELARSKGWISARYKSRHAGGFDGETPSLLMVYVPGDKVSPPVTYDRWLNFALPADGGADALTPVPQAKVPAAAAYVAETEPGKPRMPRTFTMVSLEKARDGKPAQVYFQMFSRKGYGQPVFQPRGNESVESCYRCHPNGLRAISPLGYHVRAGEAQLPKEVWQAVKAMNDAMDDGTDLKQVSWREAEMNGVPKPMLRPKAYWPIVGATKPVNAYTRTQSYIMGGTLPDGRTTSGCFQSRPTVSVLDIFSPPRAPGADNVYKLTATPKIDWKKVAGAMNCESCHNNRGRGAINGRTTQDQIDFKILVDQSMPFGMHENPLDQSQAGATVKDELTPDERIALANCLLDEFNEERPYLNAWLTQQTCN